MIITDPGGGPSSGITFSDVIERTLRLLMSGDRENLNQLTTELDTDADTLVLRRGTNGLVKGATLSVGLELMYVWDVQPTSSTVTVQRGYAGSDQQTHAVTDLVEINPRFPRFVIGQAINDELSSLAGKGLFQMRSLDLTFNPSTVGYDFGTQNVIDIYEISYPEPVGANYVRQPTGYRLVRNAVESVFSSSVSLFLDSPGYAGLPVHILYKTGFSPLEELDDDVQTIAGIHSEATDVLCLGAAMRVMAPQEIRRNQLDAQGDTRRASEVPPGALLRSYQGLVQQYNQRLNEERHRLLRKYPLRRSGY